MTLQQAVFAGLVDSGQLVAVREITNPGGAVLNPAASANTNRASDCTLTAATHVERSGGDSHPAGGFEL